MKNPRLACPIAALAMLAVAAPAAVAAPGSKTPKFRLLCLPPGGKKPVACSNAQAGQTVQIVSAEKLRGDIRLVPVDAAKNPVIGRAALSPRKIPGSGAYVLTMPRHACGGESQVQFEIQVATPDLQNAESVRNSQADSLGYFQMMC